MKLFLRTPKRDPKSYDARRPHPFIDPSNAGIAGMAVSSMGGRGGGVGTAANLFATSRVVRTSGCVVPGCGKAVAEDIHAPADE